MKPITSFNVKPHNLPNLISQLTAMANSGDDWVVSAKLKQSSRSQLQNDSYWQFIGEFANYLGYEKDYLHDILRYKYLYKIIDIDGVEHRSLLSTTKQTTKSMAEYIDNI